MNRNYLHTDLPVTVSKYSGSDVVIGQREEDSDINPWENVGHNEKVVLYDSIDPIIYKWRWGDLRKGDRFLYSCSLLFFPRLPPVMIKKCLVFKCK